MSARDQWKRRLAFLEEEEAKCSDPNQRFTISEQIKEAKEKLRHLGRDLAKDYRAWLGHAHRHLVPFFETESRVLDDVYVTLHVIPGRQGDDKDGFESEAKLLDERTPGRKSSYTIRELLDLPRDGKEVTGSWVILGEPGSGKSTICRKLCHDLSKEPEGPLPVLVNLSDWLRSEKNPFEFVESLLSQGHVDARFAGLGEELARQAQTSGRVWVLLDGLDELDNESRERFTQVLLDLREVLADSVLVVTSRHTDFESPGAIFREAELQGLNAGGQSELLDCWIGSMGREEIRRLLLSRPRLQELAPNPLMLTMVAQLYRDRDPDRRDLPTNRSTLYDQSVRLLLRRGHRREKRGVKSVTGALKILPELCFSLQRSNVESWTFDEVYDVLDAVLDEKPRLERSLKREWEGPEDFLRDMGQNSGLIGEHDGPGTPWRFLHRAFRDYLAAAALRDGSLSKKDSQLADLLRDLETDEARWGETFALLCGLLEKNDPRRRTLLEALVAGDRDLALRTLPQLEGLDPSEALKLLRRVRKGEESAWNGDDLAHLVRGLLLERSSEEEVREAVLLDVSQDLATEELAYRYYALVVNGLSVDREDFFRRCRRGLPKEDELPQMISVSGGTFMMGSPETEKDRDDDEVQHEVTLRGFELAATVVTQGQYARFEEREVSRPGYPATELNWWEAWLYCRWAAARLPTEAEWEYACRAGTETPFSFGEDITSDQVNYDGKFPYRGRKGASRDAPVAVGSLPQNPWGFYEMHGNVWEWCQDWFGEDDVEDSLNPGGPSEGHERVLRGGSWVSLARHVRSAYRFRNHPAYRDVNLGFRLSRGQDEGARGASQPGPEASA